MRSTKGEQTRAAIAEAALRMFREQGYEATTMRAIAREAGVATGNAYYYFGSKEELIHAYYADPGAGRAAKPTTGTALAVLDGDRALLGARHLARVREDLPAHRRDRAAGRAAGPAG